MARRRKHSRRPRMYTAAAVDLYMFICETRRGRVRVFIAADSEEGATAEVRRRGYLEHSAARVWQPAPVEAIAGECRTCGYKLEHLPTVRGWVVCPECGSRQSL